MSMVRSDRKSAGGISHSLPWREKRVEMKMNGSRSRNAFTG
jgi:hypothetical protein